MNSRPPDILQALIRNDEDRFLAECIEIPVTAEGGSLEESVINLKRAVSAYLAEHDHRKLGYAEYPRLVITQSTCRWKP